MYTDPVGANIHGGVATIGTSGVIYFSTLSSPNPAPLGTAAKVTALNANGTPKWPSPFTAPGYGTTYDMYAIPALDAAGAKLYIGSDYGIFYCRNTSDGTAAAGWTDYTVPGTGDRRIRSGAALSPDNSTVYFHCNDGYLYALDASSGAFRWRAPTGNAGGPPVDATWDPQPVSSSPVVDPSGMVYVGSADGSVYSFNPTTHAQNWQVILNTVNPEPVEATIAIGQDGTLYAGTRVNHNNAFGGTIYAINPTTAAIVWSSLSAGGNGAGFIASPVIDQSGFIYAAEFGETVDKLDPATGTSVKSWMNLNAKLCQTPSINQDGLLIVGLSAFPGLGEVNKIAAFKTGDTTLTGPLWVIQQAGNQNLGSSFGSPAIKCTSSGTTYFTDALGHVCRFDTGATMMAGQWPTFQSGNRRAGKSISYPMAIAELPNFLYADTSGTKVNRVDLFGRAVGQAYGYFNGACGGSGFGYGAALWQNNSISLPGYCPGVDVTNSFATALNETGDVCGWLYYPGPNPYVPIVWPDGANSDGIYTSLSTTATDNSTYPSAYAYAINESSTIIGYGLNGSAVHVLRWPKSGSTWIAPDNLGAPAGGQAYAYAITENEFLAGKATFSSGAPFHAFRTDSFPTSMSLAIDLGTMGGTASEAWDIDDLQGTVGRSQVSAGYWRGFLLPITCSTLGNNEFPYRIPPLAGVARTDWSSAAYGVNTNGLVVGFTQDQNLANRAFRYSNQTGVTTDLNTITLDGGQTPAGLGWTLTQAQAINNAGVIVGYGSISGRATCWILYPKCQD